MHLGLQVGDPADRERRFAGFLRSLPEETDALYLLGDIWDFWYEYRDVVPKGYVRVFSALVDLIDRGVKVYFFQGNHDVWSYSYFEELGMKRLVQPYVAEIGGRRFCLGHGDGLGPVPAGYRFLRGVFHNKVLQFMFSLLHPWIAFRFGNGWSRSNRLAHDVEYEFRGSDEPLYKFAASFDASSAASCAVSSSVSSGQVDYFVFGHYHADVHLTLPSGAQLFVLKDWISSSPYLCFDGDRFI